jgi:hypothetical protein
MSLLSIHSSPIIRSDVDLFSMYGTDTTVEESYYQDYKPLVNIQDSNSKIEFRIVGNSNQYIDLADHFLYLRVKIVDKDGADLLTTDDYSLTNFFFHTMFSGIEVSLQNQLITDGNNCYGYKSYIETICSHGQDYFLAQVSTC